jgi:hypothetical protein
MALNLWFERVSPVPFRARGFLFLGPSPRDARASERGYSVNGAWFHTWFLASLTDLVLAILGDTSSERFVGSGSYAYCMYTEESVDQNELYPVGYVLLGSFEPDFVEAKLYSFPESQCAAARGSWEGDLPSRRYPRVLDMASGKVYLVNAMRDRLGLAATPGDLQCALEVFEDFIDDWAGQL